MTTPSATDDTFLHEELALLRESARRFCEKEFGPQQRLLYRRERRVPREVWERAGAAGLLCLEMPEEYGGGGGNFRHEVVFAEETARVGFTDFGAHLHSAIVAPYIARYGTEDQKRRLLPRMATGELIGAIAMTEPGTGSDLQAIKTTAKLEGDHWVVRGQKTFITNGQNANLILLACKTDPTAGARGVSMLLVETDGLAGFQRGRNLEKVGWHAQDTSELFFEEVKLPQTALLGGEANRGFYQMMEQLPQERLLVGVQALGLVEAALRETIAYTKDRKAFGKTVFDFQNTKFQLAESATEAKICRVFLDDCVDKLVRGELDATTAVMAKYWLSERASKIIDSCVQLFGGYGFMAEYPVGVMWTDVRVMRIYAGTNEIMKELISRTL